MEDLFEHLPTLSAQLAPSKLAKGDGVHRVPTGRRSGIQRASCRIPLLLSKKRRVSTDLKLHAEQRDKLVFKAAFLVPSR